MIALFASAACANRLSTLSIISQTPNWITATRGPGTCTRVRNAFGQRVRVRVWVHMNVCCAIHGIAGIISFSIFERFQAFSSTDLSPFNLIESNTATGLMECEHSIHFGDTELPIALNQTSDNVCDDNVFNTPPNPQSICAPRQRLIQHTFILCWCRVSSVTLLTDI